MTTRQNDSGLVKAGRTVLARAGGGAASVLRAVAGMPAGVARTRRGTFLVVVIGTLALLAVIAIAHFAIGQSDRRASAAVERAAKIDEVPDQFAQYVLGVIGKDATDVVPEEINEVMPPGSADYLMRFMATREAVDRPFTDWRVLTTEANPSVAVGGFDVANRAFHSVEGVGSDPWLADIAPTWLNWEGRPPTAPFKEYEYRRDWGHISNLAPDGKFVNLANLRNNFAAEPGFGVVGAPGRQSRMSQRLSLLQPLNPDNPYQWGVSVQTDFGLTLGPANALRPSLARQRAAAFDSRQRGAFRAVSEWAAVLPSDPGSPGNQWADADGDGFYDSRWFEMVDSRGTGSVRSFLQTDGRVRWVFAARVIDLSGMVNVNTATDNRYEPGAAHPIGLNPADIDLKRLLSLQDSYVEWGVQGGYNGVLQPSQQARAPIASNYGLMDQEVALRLGRGAYDSLRWSIVGSLVPERFDAPQWDWLNAGVPAAERGLLRQSAWRTAGGSMAGASYQSSVVRMPAQFPATDMGELLGRFGVNDPQETSRVETATAARRPGGGGGPALVQETSFDPLRSNRDGALEANRTGAVNGQGVYDTGLTTEQAMLLAAVDVRHQVTTISGARPVANLYGNDFVGAGYPKGNELLSQEARLNLGTPSAQEQAPDSVSLFRMYTRSLAPAVKLLGVWPKNGVLPAGGGAEFQKARTLFYGHQGPELALLTAGQMAVNAEVMLSTDGKIANPRTLVFSADYARRMYQSPQSAPVNGDNVVATPWFLTGSYCLEPNVEDLPPILAQGNDATIQTPALNLYGFEPQAFITEVGSFTVWRDTPGNRGGDLDIFLVHPNHPNDPPPGFITIRGQIDGDNPDLMFRCVTFQLHNPYNEPVTLSVLPQREGSLQMSDWRDFQYVKLMTADQRTQMGAAVLCDASVTDDGQLGASGLTLQAGETVACCLFSRRPDSLAAWLTARGMFSTPQAATAFLHDWARRQFVGQGVQRAVFVLGINDQITDIAGGFKNYVDDPNGTKGLTVQLWKSRRANMTPYGGQDEVLLGAPNLPGNDQLMDRFRIPANSGHTLDERIKDGPGLGNEGVEVDQCYGGQENRPFSPLNYNTGLTLMRWSTVSRPLDPRDGVGGTLPLGAVPAYAMEPKNPSSTWHTYKSEDSGVGTTTTLEVDKAVAERLKNSNHEAEFVTDDWVQQQVATTVSPTISKGPADKSTADVSTVPANLDGRSYAQVRDLMSRAARVDKGFNGGGAEGLFAAKIPGQADRISTLRAADLLLPMGIGPWESPLKPDLTAQDNPDIRYLTAGEAFALAYGYEAIPAPSASPATADPAALYTPAPAAQNAADGGIGDTRPRPVLVGGHVVIDDFVPFYDGNQNGMFDRGNAYNGLTVGQAGQKDIRFGLGIPAALNVLDQVNAWEDGFGSLRRAVPGVVNLNTATPTVLRALPLLTPADRSWGGSNDLVWDNGWEQTRTNIDLAASVLAYRDKRLTLPLPTRATPAAFDLDGQAPFKPFANVAGNVFTEAQAGRARATQMDGIREEAGFRSVGELACVLQRDPDDRGGTGTRRSDAGNIDALGFNNQARNAGGVKNDRKGINSLQFKDPGGATVDVDGVRNDFAERIQVLSALSNIATVRSDVFACWFVVRGYTQDDCENLGPDDVMAPSIERRFLMVIDRSNVTSILKDPRPRVVLFKELPR